MAEWNRRSLLAALGGTATVGGGAYWFLEGDDLDCLSRREPRWSAWTGRFGHRWSPPVLDDGTVFATEAYGMTYTTNEESSYRIAALEPYRGGAQWAYREVGAGGGVPRVRDDVVYVPTGNNRVYAFDRDTGHLRWEYDAGESRTESGSFAKPAMAGDAGPDGTVVVAVDYPGADRFDGAGTWLVGLDAADGSERWRRPTAGPVESGPVVAGDTVVAADDRGTVYGVDPVDGSGRWERRVGDRERATYGFPAVAGTDPVGVVTAGGTVAALDATGDEQWSTRIDPPERTTTTADGDPEWTLEAATVDGDRLLVGDSAGVVTAFDRLSGTRRWQYRATAEVGALDAGDAGYGVGSVACVLDQRGVVHVLDRATGDRLDRFRVTEGQFTDYCGWLPRYRRATGLALGDGVVYVTCRWLRQFPLRNRER